jgi:predicted kinase
LGAQARRTTRVRDLRGAVAHPGELVFAAGDLVVVSGLPGSGKSTLIDRAARGGAVADSQDARTHWEQRLPASLPYGLYRPLVRLSHFAGLWRLLRSGAEVVVHDCGSLPWVRRWLAHEARRRGRELHLVLLDVTPETALAGQTARGRGVSGPAFSRHRAAVLHLVRTVAAGRLPEGCASAHLLDRAGAGAVRDIRFAR